MRFLRQSTATVVVVGVFPSPITGAAVTNLTSQSGRLTKAGVGTAFTPTSWAHDFGGHYLIGLASGDVDTIGRLRIAFDSASYLPVWEDFTVLSAAVYDWLFGTTAPLTDKAGYTVAGRVDANVTHVAGAVAATVAAPTNWSALAVDGSGRVTVGVLPDPAPAGYGGGTGGATATDVADAVLASVIEVATPGGVAVTLRAAIAYAAAGAGAGLVSGAGTTGPSTVTIGAAGQTAGHPRMSVSGDGVGNRTSVTLIPPA
jgi:hypothetical protein